MADDQLSNASLAEDEDLLEEEAIDEDAPLLERKPLQDTAELDITPMIDIVFLLLIFFLVTSIPDPDVAVELPPARHGDGVSEQASLVITIAERPGSRPSAVYLADGKRGNPLSDDPTRQEEAITAYVNDGVFNKGKSTVIIKAEKRVKHREVSNVGAAAGKVEGVQLHLAVYEKD